MTETIDIQTLVQDDHNFNKGTDAGRQLMEKSFKELGAGRSILVDKDGRIIAGNKSQQAAIAAGIKKVRIIETTGDELVAVKRTDLSLDSKEGRELALADNLTTQINLTWDDAELALAEYESGIDPKEWGLELGNELNADDFGEEINLPEGDKAPFCQMSFQLANPQAEMIKAAVEAMKQTDEYKNMETHGNRNTNGNALAKIIEQWAEQRK